MVSVTQAAPLPLTLEDKLPSYNRGGKSTELGVQGTLSSDP